MKKILLLLTAIFMIFKSNGQSTENEIVPLPNKSIPLTLYVSPVMDGASFAIEWTFKNQFSLNLYALKRKSDDMNSNYYGTKAKENLTELMFKIYTSKSTTKKFKTFFGPCIGARNIIFDENFFRGFEGDVLGSGGFFGGRSLEIDAKAKAKYMVPMYFGLDYKNRQGLIFEYAAGISFQQSSGNTRIRGPITTPYTEGFNLRSRFLFGYQF